MLNTVLPQLPCSYCWSKSYVTVFVVKQIFLDLIHYHFNMHGFRYYLFCILYSGMLASFPPNGEYRRLVARAYSAMRMVKVPRLNVRAKLVRRHCAQKHINRPLGQWPSGRVVDISSSATKVDSSSSGSTNRIRVRRLVREAMNKDCTRGKVAHGGGSVHVWGVLTLSYWPIYIWDQAIPLRCHGPFES